MANLCRIVNRRHDVRDPLRVHAELTDDGARLGGAAAYLFSWDGN